MSVCLPRELGRGHPLCDSARRRAPWGGLARVRERAKASLAASTRPLCPVKADGGAAASDDPGQVRQPMALGHGQPRGGVRLCGRPCVRSPGASGRLSR